MPHFAAAARKEARLDEQRALARKREAAGAPMEPDVFRDRMREKLTTLKYNLSQTREDVVHIESQLYAVIRTANVRRRATRKNISDRELLTSAAREWLINLAASGAPLPRYTVAYLLTYKPVFPDPASVFETAIREGTLAMVLELLIHEIGVPAGWRSGPVPPPAEAVLHQLVLLEYGLRRPLLDAYMAADQPELALKAYRTVFPIEAQANPQHIAVCLATSYLTAVSPVALLPQDLLRHISILATASNNGIYS